jgi:hypothetical protein
MSDQTNRELTETLTLIRIDIAKLGEQISQLKDMKGQIDDVDDTAKEALQSTRSAHKRLDDLKENEIKDFQGQFTWGYRLIVGGFVLQVIAFVFVLAKMGLNGK